MFNNFPTHRIKYVYRFGSQGAFVCNGNKRFSLKSQFPESFSLFQNDRSLCTVVVLIDPHLCHTWKLIPHRLTGKNPEAVNRILPAYLLYYYHRSASFNYYIHIQIENGLNLPVCMTEADLPFALAFSWPRNAVQG